MDSSSRYWTICRINAASESSGYTSGPLPLAQEFFHQQFLSSTALGEQPNTANRCIPALLLSWFRTENSSIDAKSRALAGLCLRCYVSLPILKACKKLASLFGTGNQFTYRDLLEFVLNDDGKTLIILDSKGKTQIVLNEKGDTQEGHYEFFSVEILRSYSLNAESRLSLDNWVYYQTRRNHDLRKFLSEWGFRSLSNWALLNRVGTKQLELLLDRDRYLIETFHAVYRRDRRYQQRRHDVRRCPDPTTDQLKEMSHLLQERGIILKSPSQLKEELQRVAQLLQDYDVWNRRGSPLSMPLETPDPDTEDRTERDFADPRSINDLNELEQSEFLEFIRQQLMEILEESIEQVLNEYITSLKQRSRYASLASKVIPGLRLIYCQGLSQKEIASRLGMTNQSKVSRVLNQQNLLNQVRLRTVEKLSSIILERVQTLELANLAAEPNYLRNLWHHLEGFLDEEVFQQAAAEIRTANNRSMNSLYAQRLRCYIEKHKE